MMEETRTILAEFTLSQPEMLALLFTAQASAFFGLDNARLIPDTQLAQRELTLRGLDMLEQRGLVTRENGNYVMDGTLGLMAGALAYPAVVTILTRDIPGEGQQQILHYRLDPANVELTMPNENTYRLAALEDEVAALERVRELLPILVESSTIQARTELSQDEFLRVKNLAEKNNPQQAEAILTAHGMSAEDAIAMVQAIGHPILGGTVTFLRVSEGTVVAGRDVAMVQDEQSAWLIRGSDSQTQTLIVETVTPVEYSIALVQAMREVLETVA